MKKQLFSRRLGDVAYFLTLAVIFALFSAFTFIKGSENITIEKTETKTVSGIQSEEVYLEKTVSKYPEETPPLITETRTLCEYGGELAVFDCFGEMLYTKDCDLMLFSPEDRRKLSDGILFDSERELTEFLESFGS